MRFVCTKECAPRDGMVLFVMRVSGGLIAFQSSAIRDAEILTSTYMMEELTRALQEELLDQISVCDSLTNEQSIAIHAAVHGF